jgi:hypothetical protein
MRPCCLAIVLISASLESIVAADGTASLELLEDVNFAEGFGASWNYGRKFTLHPTRREGKATEYRDISPWHVFLIPGWSRLAGRCQGAPLGFRGRAASQLHGSVRKSRTGTPCSSARRQPQGRSQHAGQAAIRSIQQLRVEAGRSPAVTQRLVKRITTDRHGTIRLYYNTQNDIRNAATEHTAKWARDTWPHLLLNQTFDTLPRLRDIGRLDLRLDFQVHQLRRLSAWPGVNRSSMNLKFMFFLRGIDDPDQKLFAGMMLQSSRESNYAASRGRRSAWDGLLSRFDRRVSIGPDLGERCSVHREIKSLIRDALTAAKEKQPYLSANPDDYYLFNFSVGWEGLGPLGSGWRDFESLVDRNRARSSRIAKRLLGRTIENE